MSTQLRQLTFKNDDKSWSKIFWKLFSSDTKITSLWPHGASSKIQNRTLTALGWTTALTVMYSRFFYRASSTHGFLHWEVFCKSKDPDSGRAWAHGWWLPWRYFCTQRRKTGQWGEKEWYHFHAKTFARWNIIFINNNNYTLIPDCNCPWTENVTCTLFSEKDDNLIFRLGKLSGTQKSREMGEMGEMGEMEEMEVMKIKLKREREGKRSTAMTTAISWKFVIWRKLPIKQILKKYSHQRPQPTRIIWVCTDIWVFF